MVLPCLASRYRVRASLSSDGSRYWRGVPEPSLRSATGASPRSPTLSTQSRLANSLSTRKPLDWRRPAAFFQPVKAEQVLWCIAVKTFANNHVAAVHAITE